VIRELSTFPPGRAAIFSETGKPFQFLSKKLLPLRAGEVLVRVLYTTICGSDIHTYCGRRQEPPNVVLGHEIVGEILEISSSHLGVDMRSNPIATGDRVIWSIFSVPPGNTAPRADMPQKSSHLFKYGHALAIGDDIFNGGLAEYCVLRSETALIKISHRLPLKVAATISCAHATVMGAIRVAGEVSGKKVMVFGAGLLGLTCLAMCREAGAEWIGLMDQDQDRLAWGKKFSADGIFHEPDSNATTMNWPDVDIVFDMTGNPEVMKAGVDSLKTGGIAVWIGAVYPEKPVSVDGQQVVRKLLQIRGLHNYNYDDLFHATVFIENYYMKYPYEELIEKEFDLDEIEDAFVYACEHKPVRVGIRITNE
jgi:alcohol dehydrogenase